jgi:hypothetical protein
MPAQLRLSEAQTLFEAIREPMLRPALEAFFEEQKRETIEMLLSAVRQGARDTMKEARLAGKVEAYENTLREMELFAKEQLEQASQ